MEVLVTGPKVPLEPTWLGLGVQWLCCVGLLTQLVLVVLLCKRCCGCCQTQPKPNLQQIRWQQHLDFINEQERQRAHRSPALYSREGSQGGSGLASLIRKRKWEGGAGLSQQMRRRSRRRKGKARLARKSTRARRRKIRRWRKSEIQSQKRLCWMRRWTGLWKRPNGRRRAPGRKRKTPEETTFLRWSLSSGQHGSGGKGVQTSSPQSSRVTSGNWKKGPRWAPGGSLSVGEMNLGAATKHEEPGSVEQTWVEPCEPPGGSERGDTRSYPLRTSSKPIPRRKPRPRGGKRWGRSWRPWGWSFRWRQGRWWKSPQPWRVRDIRQESFTWWTASWSTLKEATTGRRCWTGPSRSAREALKEGEGQEERRQKLGPRQDRRQGVTRRKERDKSTSPGSCSSSGDVGCWGKLICRCCRPRTWEWTTSWKGSGWTYRSARWIKKRKECRGCFNVFVEMAGVTQTVPTTWPRTCWTSCNGSPPGHQNFAWPKEGKRPPKPCWWAAGKPSSSKRSRATQRGGRGHCTTSVKVGRSRRWRTLEGGRAVWYCSMPKRHWRQCRQTGRRRIRPKRTMAGRRWWTP